MFALQGLDPGQLIGTHDALSLLSQDRGLVIHLTNGDNGVVSLRILRRRQPIADQMRLEIPFFKRRPACRGEIVGTIPRRITSSAISRPVH